MIPARWSELEPLLDQALDADEAGRAALLASLRDRDPTLADALGELLASGRAAQDEAYLQPLPVQALIAAPQAGRQLGNYTLVEPIGDGGMGSVWLARRSDGRFDGMAAVKLLSRGMGSATVAERFRREGQFLARLDHPNIARLLDAGITPQGQAYLVLEHVRGQRIDTHCDQQRLDVRARLRLFGTLLAAVAHAHRHLVVHRDIKPGNVMVTAEGQVKLLDFGIAKLLADEVATGDALTEQAGGPLTPGYAAPEQYLDEPVSTATDVYALGVLLYGLLAGRHPTLGPTANFAEALQATLHRDAPRLSDAVTGQAEVAAQRNTTPAALRRQLAGDLDKILAKALRRPAAERYADAAALADDLQRHLDHQPVLARAPGPGLRLAKFLRRQRVPVAIALAGLLALGVAGGNAWQQRQAAREGQARAQSVDGLLQSLFDGMSPDNAASRSFSARELLDRGRAFLDRSEGLDPATRRAARLRMAALYRDIGAYDQAAQAYRAEAGAAAAAQQPERQARALLDLANVQLKTPQTTADAGATLQAAASLLADTGPARPELDARHALLRAEWLLETQPPQQAGPAFARAVALFEADRAPALEWLARALVGQAETARRLGERADAVRLLDRAATLQGQRGEAGAVDRLDIRLRVGRLENGSGQFDAAARTLAAVHAELNARLGPQQLETLAAANELAYAQMRSGQSDPARQTIALLDQAEGPAAVWRRLDGQRLGALMAMYQGQAAQAEPALRQVLETVAQAEGGVTARTEPLRRLHAEALLRLRRHDEAATQLRLTERQQVQLSHPQHVSVAITRVLIGCLQARTGDLPGARQTWSAASPVLTRELGPQHPFALAAQSYLALAASTDDALAADREALARRVQQELGWQDGAASLARLLRAPPASIDWAQLPVVL